MRERGGERELERKRKTRRGGSERVCVLKLATHRKEGIRKLK